MVYSDDELNANEEIILDLRPNWWFLAGSIFYLIISLIFASVIFGFSNSNGFLQIIAILPAVFALLYFVQRYASWMTTRFVLTTDRIANRSGLLHRQGIEIPLERVNTVFFSQTFFERILRTGDLVIESAGEQGQQKFSNIPNPLGVQNEIQHQMDAQKDHSRTMISQDSIPDQIDKLDRLRQRGVITEEEFQIKKADLLSRL